MKSAPFLICISVFLFVIHSCGSHPEPVLAANNPIKNDPIIVGAMKNVMRKGELFPRIDLDTIKTKEHLYGMGPVEHLRGEIMILDGKSFKSEVQKDSSCVVSETFQLKAPFFAYANIEKWKESLLPDSVADLQQLENFLNAFTQNDPRPFFFKITTKTDSAEFHIVNLPEGTKVSSPEEAHQGQRNYWITNTEVELLGFFSTEHQTIFTHHSTFLHVHIISADRKKMGHLEKIKFKKGGVRLFLPQN